jgi:hypothetical protein
MNVKKSLGARIRGWLPKTPNFPKQPSAPSFRRTEVIDEKQLIYKNFPVDSSTSLTNGLLIGGSAAVFLIGLLLWSSLNSVYWSQRNTLIMLGLNVSNIDYVLIDTVTDISFCAAAVVVSSYLLIFTSVNQLNPIIRTLSKQKKSGFALANGLMTGGGIALMSSVSNAVWYSYPSASTSPPFFSISFGATGAILISAGVLWIAYLYIKFRKLLTVTQGALAISESIRS